MTREQEEALLDNPKPSKGYTRMTAEKPLPDETPQAYLARIGAKGGRKSKRKLSKKEAKRMAEARWKKPQPPTRPKP